MRKKAQAYAQSASVYKFDAALKQKPAPYLITL